MGNIRYGFVLVSFLLAFSAAGQEEVHREWLKIRERVKQDKSVSRHYTFEDVEDSGSIVEDLSSSGAGLKFVAYKDRETKEVFDDLEVIEGRWPGKKAVRLDRGWYEGPAVNVKGREFTAEVWFRRQGPGSLPPTSVSYLRRKVKNGTILSSSGYYEGWRIITSYNHYQPLNFCIGQKEGSSWVGTRTPLPDNIWHHLAVRWSGNNIDIFINGRLVEQQLWVRDKSKKDGPDMFTGEYVPTETPFKIGYTGVHVGTVKLDIDEVVIYDRALKAEEIKERSMERPVNAVFSSADALIAAGDYEAARAEYGKLEGALNYGREQVLFNIAESYRLEKDYEKAHRTYREIIDMEGLSPFSRINAFFSEAEVCLEEKDYAGARKLYEQVIKSKGALGSHVFEARLFTGDTYKAEKKHEQAREIYKTLLREEELSAFPNDVNRLDLRDRLEEIDGLADGAPVKSIREKRVELVNSPSYAIYVSAEGSDENSGTKDSPFATMQRAQKEVRRVKEAGMPEGGIAVYLRGGIYFVSEGITFTGADSGMPETPVVYRSYPGENVRIAGCRRITGFKLLDEPGILKRLPGESRGKVWVADLKEAGITNYGKLLNRGRGTFNPGAMELLYNGRVMQLARWPNNGWERISALVNPGGDFEFRGSPYEQGKFIYSGDRPERWQEEKEIWIKEYSLRAPYHVHHLKVDSIDTEKKIMYVEEDPKWADHKGPRYVGAVFAANAPYFAYNLLSEIDMPGEWYIDRDAGRLYFYPPGSIEDSEILATTLPGTIITLDGASNIAFFGLTVEGTWSHAFEIKGSDNMIAASVIRNTGQWAVRISGRKNAVVGCDIYDTGEGGVFLRGGERKRLIPARNTVENNHIYRFNRFCGGGHQAVNIGGVGQRVSHNVMHDSPMQAIVFNDNDHIIEFNDMHDVVHEGRELGAIYIYGVSWALMNRGTVIRNNLFHHISTNSSPNLTHGLNAIHIDAMNAGLVIDKNIFYNFPQGIASTFPGNYITNNIFINSQSVGINQSDRSNLFNPERIQHMVSNLQRIDSRQPPWSFRYPQLTKYIMEGDSLKWGEKIQGSIIERNVNTGGIFARFSSGMLAHTHFKNNWDEGDPLFMDKENMDFRLRPGSPVYGVTGFMPVSTDKIGVYEDALRASWPINRTKEDIGRYSRRPEWTESEEYRKAMLKTAMPSAKRVSPQIKYDVLPRKTAIEIDGKLKPEEWLGLDKDKAMLVEKDYRTGERVGPKSYVWMLYDEKFLYVATLHEPDPWKEGMPVEAKDHEPAVEMSIESQAGPHSRGWWLEDMQTGPVYVIWGKSDGTVRLPNIFRMPSNLVEEIVKSIEYRAVIDDKEKMSWASEMKIPLEKVGINPKEAGRLGVNIGIWKKRDWIVWIPTGGKLYQVENAGLVNFVK